MRADGVSGDMIVAIYVMLFLLWVTLGVVGIIGIFRWWDERTEALVRWWQVRKIRQRMDATVTAKLREINGEQP